MTPKFEIGRDFCTMHLPSEFHPPMFTRSEVIVLTNIQTHKRTDATENIKCFSLCYDVGLNIMKEKFGLGTLYALRRGNVSDPFSSSSGLLSATKVTLHEELS